MADKSEIKLVAVGDGAVGKTSLLISYTTDEFPDDYEPTIFDNYSALITVSGKPVTLRLWDTAGQEDYDRFIPLSYPGTSCFLVCFSVMNRSSFSNVRSKWFKTIQKEAPGTPFIIIGTKVDLRTDPEAVQRLAAKRQLPVSEQDGIELAKVLGARAYCECSALTQQGLKGAFDRAIKIALRPKNQGSDGAGCCTIV